MINLVTTTRSDLSLAAKNIVPLGAYPILIRGERQVFTKFTTLPIFKPAPHALNPNSSGGGMGYALSGTIFCF